MESDILFNIKLIESEGTIVSHVSVFSVLGQAWNYAMPSSSESRSRSARRSPDRRGGETSGRPEDVDRGRMPPPEPEGRAA